MGRIASANGPGRVELSWGKGTQRVALKPALDSSQGSSDANSPSLLFLAFVHCKMMKSFENLPDRHIGMSNAIKRRHRSDIKGRGDEAAGARDIHVALAWPVGRVRSAIG